MLCQWQSHLIAWPPKIFDFFFTCIFFNFIYNWPPILQIKENFWQRVRLMCVLRIHINNFIFGKILLRIKKVVKTFSIFNKLFSKLVYYCMSLGQILVKSFDKNDLRLLLSGKLQTIGRVFTLYPYCLCLEFIFCCT